MKGEIALIINAPQRAHRLSDTLTLFLHCLHIICFMNSDS